MKVLRRIASISVAGLGLLMPGIAAPQAPPHVPGTICFTPYFYCPLQPAQRAGSPCTCHTANGPVAGVAD